MTLVGKVEKHRADDEMTLMFRYMTCDILYTIYILYAYMYIYIIYVCSFWELHPFLLWIM